MDPVTLILGAIMAAAAVVGSEMVKDGYEALKAKLIERDTEESDIEGAIAGVEKKPQSAKRRDVLCEELGAIPWKKDDPVVLLAQELLQILRQERHLSEEHYQAILQGSGAIAQGTGSAAAGQGGVAATGEGSRAIKIDHLEIHSETMTEKPTVSFQQAYLEEVAKEMNLLPWSSVSFAYADPEKGESFSLADIYTDLDTTELRHIEREDELRQFLAHMHEKERIPAQDTVNQQAKLLIMGDPGAGKSTFVKHIGYLLAQAGLAEKPANWLKKLSPWDHGQLLPVWVELRKISAFAETHKDREGPANVLLSYLGHLLLEWNIQEFAVELNDIIRGKEQSVLFLLDGLDEVPYQQRQLMVDMVNEMSHRYGRHRYLVTCRPYAYVGQPWRLKQFHEVTLAPFSEKQIDRFIENWYERLKERKRLNHQDATRRMEKLQAATRRPDLRGLAERPLLLTVMAQLHTFKGQLPDDRTELYAEAVDLLLKRWESRTEAKEGILEHLQIPGLKMSDLEAGLYDVAFQVHGKGVGDGTADIDEGLLLMRLPKYLGKDLNKAKDFINYIRERAGLLISHKTDAYTFPHRTFQEFLAACYLVGQPDFPKEAADLLRQDISRWTEVFILSCGYAAKNQQLGQAIAAVNALCPQVLSVDADLDAEAWRRAEIAGSALTEIGLIGVQREPAGQVVLERVQNSLVTALTQDSTLPARDRVAAGRTLAKLGDPRKAVLDPMHIEWCDVPAGSFLMGDDNKEYTIPYDYRISRFPMTQAQFQAFVEAGGYEKEAYWPEAKEAGMWADGRVQGGLDKKPRGMPEAFSEPFNLTNHPVVGVTWYETLAFTRWLTEEMRKKEGLSEGFAIQLPNEPEWEKAARGTDGRTYPWGNDADPNRANYEETGINTTSAVGCFPGGVSPYRVEDMSGNVWEWTRSVFDQYPYPSEKDERTQRENPQSDKPRVFRGGSFFYSDDLMRCAGRDYLLPSNRSYSLGFRVVVSPCSGL